MWWVNFVAGVFVGAFPAVFLFALIIAGSEGKRHD